jgi:hypothetical protein
MNSSEVAVRNAAAGAESAVVETLEAGSGVPGDVN